MARSMLLLSWNVAGRVRNLAAQIQAIGRIGAEVVALQEVTTKSTGQFREGLSHLGFKYILDSNELAKDKSSLSGPRKYFELVASRFHFRPLSPKRKSEFLMCLKNPSHHLRF